MSRPSHPSSSSQRHLPPLRQDVLTSSTPSSKFSTIRRSGRDCVVENAFWRRMSSRRHSHPARRHAALWRVSFPEDVCLREDVFHFLDQDSLHRLRQDIIHCGGQHSRKMSPFAQNTSRSQRCLSFAEDVQLCAKCLCEDMLTLLRMSGDILHRLLREAGLTFFIVSHSSSSH